MTVSPITPSLVAPSHHNPPNETSVLSTSTLGLNALSSPPHFIQQMKTVGSEAQLDHLHQQHHHHQQQLKKHGIQAPVIMPDDTPETVIKKMVATYQLLRDCDPDHTAPLSLNHLRLVAMDLSNVHFSHVTLKYADLTGATLIESNLSAADLTGATLIKANLTDSDLTGATLIESNLTDSDLTGATLIESNLSTADLSSTNLTGSNLSRANLTDACLRFAHLIGATLTDATIQRVDISFATVTQSNFSGTQIDHTDFTCTNATETNFSDAAFHHSILYGVDFSGATMQRCQIRHHSLCDTHFTGTTLEAADLRHSDLSNAHFDHTILDRAQLSGCTLHLYTLHNIQSMGANLDGAMLYPTVTQEANDHSAIALKQASINHLLSQWEGATGVPTISVTYFKDGITIPPQETQPLIIDFDPNFHVMTDEALSRIDLKQQFIGPRLLSRLLSMTPPHPHIDTIRLAVFSHHLTDPLFISLLTEVMEKGDSYPITFIPGSTPDHRHLPCTTPLVISSDHVSNPMIAKVVQLMGQEQITPAISFRLGHAIPSLTVLSAMALIQSIEETPPSPDTMTRISKTCQHGILSLYPVLEAKLQHTPGMSPSPT